MRFQIPVAVAALVAGVTAVHATTPREELTRAAFATSDKAQALALVNQAISDSQKILARSPNDREAKLQLALGIGYRGQLKRSSTDAKNAQALFKALVSANPHDPEAQVALAGWHLTAVGDLGSFLARSVLGASRDQGYAALDRAVALGGDHAFFPGYAALIRIDLDSSDTATALSLAQRSVAAQATTPIDRAMQSAAIRTIPLLQAGNGTGASKLAKRLLPFGTMN